MTKYILFFSTIEFLSKFVLWFYSKTEGPASRSRKGREMSAYTIEHSIHISFEELEGMGVADRDIEVDYTLRSLACFLERSESELWWLWR